MPSSVTSFPSGRIPIATLTVSRRQVDDLERIEGAQSPARQLLDRRGPDLDRVIADTRLAAQAAQETVRADAAEVLVATLEEVQRRVMGGSVPVIARYGALPVELGMHLREAQAASRDEAAVVVIVPHPDRHGYTERKAFAVVDVSAIYRP